MDRISVTGGPSLKGIIPISGAKNAALPLMAASLLTDQPLILHNVPSLTDVHTMAILLEHCGALLSVQEDSQGQTISFRTPHIISNLAPYDIVRKMRASFLILGPLVARMGSAKLSLPGGCAIGVRAVDFHLKGLEAMGAHITLEDGYVIVQAPQGLQGAEYTFPLISVMGTENLMMAATLAKGTTRLMNAALEPEVVDLGHCLQKMGAVIHGLGTHEIIIEGQSSLKGATHTVIPDRIEAGTYIMAAAMSDGEVELKGITSCLLPTIIPILTEAGVSITETAEGLHVKRYGKNLNAVNVTTAPFPGLATDLQAQLMALLTMARGTSLVTETIYENRFMHVPELCRLGADIQIKGHTAVIKGETPLRGAPVMATDLRASVSLIMAGLIAEGTTVVHRVYHLDRGYAKIEEKLGACGALIERLHGDSDDLYHTTDYLKAAG